MVGWLEGGGRLVVWVLDGCFGQWVIVFHSLLGVYIPFADVGCLGRGWELDIVAD